jgi:lipoyltransferase 1
MNLKNAIYSKLNSIKNLIHTNRRALSTHIHGILPEKEGNLALFSLSNNIFYNLALENYLAETINTTSRNILLLWISEPCIVIGRHQNPWLECNVKEAHSNLVKVVRRYSGGGCVYHDLGNLNMSFITNRQNYDRQVNLDLIKNSLEQCSFENIEFEISPRHDIFVRKSAAAHSDTTMYKISGSAARLAQNFSYHHCTLLFDCDIDRMRLLRSNLTGNIVTKATPSVRSPCLNLKPYLKKDTKMDLDEISAQLCREYWRLNHQKWCIDHLFNYINPEEEHIAKLLEKSLLELQSWDHIFGTSPKFHLNINLNESTILSLEIMNGLIKSVKINDAAENLGTNDLEDFRLSLNSLFIDCRLDKSSLVGLIEKNNLLEANAFYLPFLEFINQNIS